MADAYAVSARRGDGPTMTIGNGTASVEAGGPGLTPVELMLGSIASCMLSTMLDFAERNAIPTEGFAVDVAGDMADGPRRVAAIRATVHVGPDITPQRAGTLLRAAHRCTVHATLEHQPEMEIVLG